VSGQQPDVADLLAVVVGRLPGGQRRVGQRRMAQAVARALDDAGHLLVQAGTGTGKSVAYLVPAVRSGHSVVVSTATLALQSQLCDVDIPRIIDALAPHLSRRPVVAVLKGRANYACRLRLADAGATGPAPGGSSPGDEAGSISAAEASSTVDPEGTLAGAAAETALQLDMTSPPGRGLAAEVRRLHTWARTSATGDRDELAPAPQPRAWAQVSVSARDCVGAVHCPYGAECFAEQARARARDADIIVTNHALLALDLLAPAAILPEHDAVIVDEAHELADRVTDAASDGLTPAGLRLAQRRVAALIPEDLARAFDEAVTDLSSALAATAPGRLERLPAELSGTLLRLQTTGADAASAIEPAADDPGRLRSRRLVESAVDTAARVLAASPADVAWVEADERGTHVLKIAPLDVSGRLAANLFGRCPVVATSATLAIGGAFDVIADQFGLSRRARVPAEPSAPAGRPTAAERPASCVAAEQAGGCGTEPAVAGATPPGAWMGLDVGSPFRYERQAILYVARHLPPPARSGTDPALLDELVALVEAAGGRTLGLFSSTRAAQEAAAVVRARTSLPVLVQGEAGTGTLVRRFRDEPHTCLFGTLSLWQGVDAPGPSCQLVTVDRIPFPRPDDPLMSARAAAVDRAGGNGFRTVTAGRAAVLLAQGVGRLIRTAEDRGVVAILDPRLATRAYGPFLRASLPPMWFSTNRDTVLGALRRLGAAGPDEPSSRPSSRSAQPDSPVGGADVRAPE
jgi:ATP-dependent DNA helicase DinG